MDNHQVAEVEFWHNLYRRLGHEGFIAQRQADLERALANLPGLADELGRGLDMGCGCLSIFEGWGRNVDAYDPLLNEYDKFLPADLAREVGYLETLDGIEPGTYDWVACINVADHTEDPLGLMFIIHDLLKPHGRLYFQVNEDPVLTAPHYKLWREREIRGYLHRFNLVSENTQRGEYDGQVLYWGVYTCEK